MRLAEAVDAVVMLPVLAAAWQGFRRGGIPALAGLAGFLLGWWWTTARAAEGAAWVAGAGMLQSLARLLEPAVAGWLPPEVGGAPARPYAVVRALDELAALPLRPEVREELAEGLRSTLVIRDHGAGTVGQALALVVARLVLRAVSVYAVPLLTGLLVAAAARYLAGCLPVRLPAPLDRLLGILAGAAEAALVISLALALGEALAGLWPREEVTAWLEVLDRSPLVGRLTRWADGRALAAAGLAAAEIP